jgi:mannan endo-1,4-beta-mannosidase
VPGLVLQGAVLWSLAATVACSGAWPAPRTVAGVPENAAPGPTPTTVAPAAAASPSAGLPSGPPAAPTVVDAEAPLAGPTQPRPAYNKGTGFFVVGSKLYDANGKEFRIRGLNHLHWDNQSVGIPKTGANTERWTLDFNQSIATNLGLMERSIGNKLVPMPGNWDGTCDRKEETLPRIVDKWVATAPTWKSLERYLLLNIANEWGPDKSTIWRDGYIAAIRALRGAGINATLVIDTGGCGQDEQDILLYGAEVFNADPQKNVVFDVHIYGHWQHHPTETWFVDLARGFEALAATGLPILIGEIGPGRNIGPSPTTLTPGQVIQAAEAHEFGWLLWAWDDPAGEYTFPPRDDWFGLSFTGDYLSTADLTTFGKDAIENPVYGLKTLGRRASIFAGPR